MSDEGRFSAGRFVVERLEAAPSLNTARNADSAPRPPKIAGRTPAFFVCGILEGEDRRERPIPGWLDDRTRQWITRAGPRGALAEAHR
jgi:hypothetical protein